MYENYNVIHVEYLKTEIRKYPSWLHRFWSLTRISDIAVKETFGYHFWAQNSFVTSPLLSRYVQYRLFAPQRDGHATVLDRLTKKEKSGHQPSLPNLAHDLHSSPDLFVLAIGNPKQVLQPPGRNARLVSYQSYLCPAGRTDTRIGRGFPPPAHCPARPFYCLLGASSPNKNGGITFR